MTDRTKLTGLNMKPDATELDRISFKLDCAVDVLFCVHELLEHGWYNPSSYENALWSAVINLQSICEELHREVYTEQSEGAKERKPPDKLKPAPKPDKT